MTVHVDNKTLHLQQRAEYETTSGHFFSTPRGFSFSEFSASFLFALSTLLSHSLLFCGVIVSLDNEKRPEMSRRKPRCKT